jgi:hypothetical protein
VKRHKRWCSDGNRRGGGVSSGGSRQGRSIGGGEGEGARAPVRSRGERCKEGAGGGRQLLKRRRGKAGVGGSAWACHAVEGEGQKGVAWGRQLDHGRDGSGRRYQRRQRAPAVKVGWRTREGGGAWMRLTKGTERQQGPMAGKHLK